MSTNSKNAQICTYVERVINDSFAAENRKNDCSYCMYSLNDEAYIFIMKTNYRRVYNRVGFRLYNNFSTHFGASIRVFNSAMSELWGGPSEIGLGARINKYGLILVSGTPAGIEIDPNYSVFYDEDTPFGDLVINIIPWDGGPFDGKLYPGYVNSFGEGRVLYCDIIAYKKTDDVIYRGRAGWREYVEDYKALCDGLTPDHAIKVQRICTHTYAPKAK